MVSKRQAKPEQLETKNHQHFDKFFQKNFFEERENNLKNNLNISIKQSLPYPSETKNENTSSSSSRLESCLEEQENSLAKNETKSEAYAQNLSLLIPISGEFPNKQSTPVSKSTSTKTEPKFDDFEAAKTQSEEKLDASLIQIVDSSKNKNKILDGNDYVSSDTDYETSKNSKNEENSTRNLSKSSERSNSKSSTRSSGGYSNLSSVSSDSNSNFDKSSQKSNTKTHSHRSRLIDSNNNNKNNSSKNRNQSRESSSSASSRSSEFKPSSIPSGYKNEASFRNESKASRSTISSKTSKNNSSDEDSYSGRKTRKRYVHVDEKNDIKFGLIKSSENFNSSFESNTKRKSYYNEDEQQDRSSNLHRRLGKEYDSNKYDFKYKFSDYHHRSHDRYQAYKHDDRTECYHKIRSNESEFNSISLKTYNSGESSRNRLRTRSSSRESGVAAVVAQQGFNKSSNEKINSKSPKSRRKQSLSPSSLAKSNHNELENSIKPKANDYEYDYDRTQKENSLNYDRSKHDYKYKSIKSDSAHQHDGDDRNRKSFENEKALDKEKDSYDYKSKNSSIRSSYKSNSYERFGDEDDVKSENKSFSNSYKKYSHNSSYVKNKYYHNTKKLPKFDLRYHLNKTVYKKNFSSFQKGEDSKNDFDSMSKSGNYVNEESISTVRKRNLSNSRIDSSSKRQKE